MTKKDFELIARIVAEIPDAGYRADTAIHFADALTKTNPRFNRSRFLSACKVEA